MLFRICPDPLLCLVGHLAYADLTASLAAQYTTIR
jgi:hypothetical protein